MEVSCYGSDTLILLYANSPPAASALAALSFFSSPRGCAETAFSRLGRKYLFLCASHVSYRGLKRVRNQHNGVTREQRQYRHAGPTETLTSLCHNAIAFELEHWNRIRCHEDKAEGSDREQGSGETREIGIRPVDLHDDVFTSVNAA
ncbi:hypothetical protein QR685DRAFT_540722 [Neurospora intermedia]|uniref:Uncharacterized protein n=1 Tax=Neurospora intermedia TaxID=5142 RepID=A0ABR3DRT7_NEUIN